MSNKQAKECKELYLVLSEISSRTQFGTDMTVG